MRSSCCIALHRHVSCLTLTCVALPCHALPGNNSAGHCSVKLLNFCTAKSSGLQAKTSCSDGLQTSAVPTVPVPHFCRNLQRYIHYNSRWEAQVASQKLEAKQLELLQQKITELEDNMSELKDYTWLLQVQLLLSFTSDDRQSWCKHCSAALATHSPCASVPEL